MNEITRIQKGQRSFCYQQLGHDGPINAAEGLRAVYRKALADAVAARLSGDWNGTDDWNGWDIQRVIEIIKENHF